MESVESLNVCIFFCFYNLNESVVTTDHLIIKIWIFSFISFLFSLLHPQVGIRFLVFVYRALFLQSHLIYNLFFYYFICFSSIVFCCFKIAASDLRSSWQCRPDPRSDERLKDWIFSVFTLFIIVECAVYLFLYLDIFWVIFLLLDLFLSYVFFLGLIQLVTHKCFRLGTTSFARRSFLVFLTESTAYHFLSFLLFFCVINVFFSQFFFLVSSSIDRSKSTSTRS